MDNPQTETVEKQNNDPKGVIKIDISYGIPRPENPALSDVGTLKPLFYRVDENTILPAGAAKELSEVLKEICKVIQNYKHQPIKTLVGVDKPKVVLGEPAVELLAYNGRTGEMVSLDKQPLYDPSEK